MKDQSRFYFSSPYEKEPLEGYLSIANYSCNNRTAIQLFYYDEELEMYAPYATITVNIPDAEIADPNCIYLDTNNFPQAIALLVGQLKCAEPTNHHAKSGVCFYPEVRLIPVELFKYVPCREDF